MSRSSKPSTLLLIAAKLAVMILVVGLSASRGHASCGDYLEHKQFGKGDNPFDPPLNRDPGERCRNGECHRAPTPLPVDPLSLRVTVREISAATAPNFSVEESDKEEWSLVIQTEPNSVFHGVPLKPPIL
ncbi:hypothetical protein SH449x_004394 [Pirellulaceae bacterium SH449]